MCDIPGRISQYRGSIWCSAFTTIHLHGVGFGFCEGFLFCWGFYFKRYMRFGFFLPMLFVQKAIMRAMFVCIEERFMAGIWNLNFLVASHFLIFLGLGLSRTLLIPIRCFNHVLGVFFSPMSELVFTILLKNSSLKKNMTSWYSDNSEVPSRLTGNIYDCLFAQTEHHNQFII